MAFIKFEVDEPPRAAIRLNGTTILISASAWSRVGLEGTEFVNLWWDDRTHQVGISSTDKEDRSKFPARSTRRGISIPAKKFFDKFQLGDAQAEGELREVGDVIAFKVSLANRAASEEAAVSVRRRGGRRKKADAS